MGLGCYTYEGIFANQLDHTVNYIRHMENTYYEKKRRIPTMKRRQEKEEESYRNINSFNQLGFHKLHVFTR